MELRAIDHENSHVNDCETLHMTDSENLHITAILFLQAKSSRTSALLHGDVCHEWYFMQFLQTPFAQRLSYRLSRTAGTSMMPTDE